MDAEQIAAYWNTPDAVERNRRDTILKSLEIRAIDSYVRDGMRVLDVGCGDGETLKALADRHFILGVGIDSSRAMLGLVPPIARVDIGSTLTGATITLQPGDVGSIRDLPLGWDLIYTERCLINLPTAEAQAHAIRDIYSLLKPGGLYVMVEHSQDGLDETNALRATLGLPAIQAPWHNRYIRDKEIAELWYVFGEFDGHKGVADQEVHDFAGTYYFLSRIVHAKLAADAGVEPDYNAPVNRLALDLPLGPGPGGFRGQARLWVWRRA